MLSDVTRFLSSDGLSRPTRPQGARLLGGEPPYPAHVTAEAFSVSAGLWLPEQTPVCVLHSLRPPTEAVKKAASRRNVEHSGASRRALQAYMHHITCPLQASRPLGRQ